LFQNVSKNWILNLQIFEVITKSVLKQEESVRFHYESSSSAPLFLLCSCNGRHLSPGIFLKSAADNIKMTFSTDQIVLKF